MKPNNIAVAIPMHINQNAKGLFSAMALITIPPIIAKTNLLLIRFMTFL